MTHPQTPNGRDLSKPVEAVVVQVTLYGLTLLIIPIILFVLFHGIGMLFAGFRPLVAVGLLVVFTLAHEGFHVLGWKYWGNLPWSAFTFGIKWEALAPYAHAKAPMQADAYRLGALLPGIMTGALPYFMALLFGDGMMTIISATMISGAVGDLYVVYITRALPPDAMVLDHPENVGCIVIDEGTRL